MNIVPTPKPVHDSAVPKKLALWEILELHEPVPDGQFLASPAAVVAVIEEKERNGENWQEFIVFAYDKCAQAETDSVQSIKDVLIALNDADAAKVWGSKLQPKYVGEILLDIAYSKGATSVPQSYLDAYLAAFPIAASPNELTQVWSRLDGRQRAAACARVLKPFFDNVPSFGARQTMEYYTLLQRMCRHVGFAEGATRLPSRLGCTDLVEQCFLGKIFSVGLAQGGMENALSVETLAKMTPNSVMQEAEKDASMVALLEKHHFSVVETLVRASSCAQINVMAFFAAVVRANKRQTAENRHKLGLNSLEFMYNCFATLLRLCKPIISLDRQQMPQLFKCINAHFYTTTLGRQLLDGVPILDGATLPNSQDDMNFVSMVFFTTIAFVEYAVCPIITGIEGKFDTLTEAAENLHTAVPADPGFLALPKQQQTEYLALLTKSIAQLRVESACLTQRLAPLQRMQDALAFGTFALCYSIALAQNDFTAIEPVMPLPNPVNPSYAAMPAYVLSATTAMMTYFMRDYKIMTDSTRVAENQLNIDACIFFLSDKQIVKNPYVRLKIARLLHFGAVEIPLGDPLGDRVIPAVYLPNFQTSVSCHRYLVPALMSFLVDLVREYPTMEFGDKVQAKKYVHHLFKSLWRIPFYTKALPAYYKRFTQLFIQFAGCLVDDLGFYLDGALGSVRNAHFLDRALHHRLSSANRDEPSMLEQDTEPNTYADLQKRCEQDKNLASHFFQIAEETANAMGVYSRGLPHLFGADEILNRTAIMLNNALRQLVGPKCGELLAQGVGTAVLKQTLKDVLVLMLNLRAVPGIARALARDERSYSGTIYAKCVDICKKGTLVDHSMALAFEELAASVDLAFNELQAEDEDFGEVPDEYLDPLMFEIMSNPVTLPVSKIDIDLATIKEHLLTHDTDPFNRVPLKLEDVVPNEKLRLEIEEFKRSKRAQHKE